MVKKFCTKCGREFMAIGREVICPACKASAAEESKRAAVERAKRASWTGESVPVRISGRASTVIRQCGAMHDLPFAAALDELLKASAFFTGMGVAWEDVEPYKSHRRDKVTTQEVKPQEVKQEVKPQEAKPQDVTQEVKAAKAASKRTVESKASKASKK